MKTSECDYELPEELIAQFPPAKRGMSRLLVLDRASGAIQHKRYGDIADYVNKGDVIVLNRTKVMKARVFCKVERTGKEVEVLFLEQKPFEKGDSDELWYCLVGRSNRVKIGDKLLCDDHYVTVMEKGSNDPRFLVSGTHISRLMDEHGVMPLPPYMHRKATRNDEKRYNTVFADTLSSSAAPTASLNLTEQLLKKIHDKGATISYVDLHIGLGTFRPIDTENVEDFRIHREHISVPAETVCAVNNCRARVWAFGTTVVRTLESAAVGVGRIAEFDGNTSLFIYPGYTFRIVDVLLTNFHMPRTSLIALVYAFAGKEQVRAAYEEAKREKYQFLSYGDSMLIGEW